MNRAERHAWHTFREVMAERQPEFDGEVPVALLIMPACQGCDEHPRETREPDEIRVHFDRLASVLRPPGMTHEQVAYVLDQTAKAIRNGKVVCR
jgi:hypothetical protein